MKAESQRHSDPHFRIQDSTILTRFLQYAGITPSFDQGDHLLTKLCAACSHLPYENLTKIIKLGDGLGVGYIKRLPDEVLRDYLQYGTGGTCFSLTATFIAILDALGFEAYPILADRHYGPDTHCALVFSHDAHLLLLDPGFLIHQPTQLPTVDSITVSTGFSTLELLPHNAGRTVELFTISSNSRRSRLTYKITPVDGPTFGRAWERSFTWEMMTYPVLTRYSNGVHHYLQGDVLRTRINERTTRQKLSPEQEYEFIRTTLKINPTIIKKVFSMMA